ncbi:MAG: hypothetical protein WCF85_12655 [Rhodospirillaceae bacterium]
MSKLGLLFIKIRYNLSQLAECTRRLRGVNMSTAHAYAATNETEHQDMEAIGAEICRLVSEISIEPAKVVNALNLLKASMLLHFAHEETLMKEANFQNFFHHRRSHNYILTELSVFISSFASGRTDTISEIWPHLKTTLDTHLIRYDEDLERFLNRRAES